MELAVVPTGGTAGELSALYQRGGKSSEHQIVYDRRSRSTPTDH
jgi:hypothetical protein